MIAPVVRRVWKYQRVIRIRKSKDRQHNGQRKRTRGQTTIYKTLDIKLKIE
jgi:hypothetical protein